MMRWALLSVLLVAACTSSGATEENTETPTADTNSADPSATTATGNAEPPAGGALLGRDAVEMFLDIQGAQVYALHSFGEWLYFNGGVTWGVDGTYWGGLGTYRMKKEGTDPDADSPLPPGGVPFGVEKLGPWSGSISPKVFHSDATHVYWLDKTAIYRQGPDGVVESITLDAEPYSYQVLDGDADTVFAATDSCIRIVLMDKATLSLRVFEPENLIPLGGALDVVSDGDRVYCAGMRSLLAPGYNPQSTADTTQAIHAIDKVSGTLSRADLSGGAMPPKITGMLYYDGTVYAGSNTYAEFGTLVPSTGVFTSLVQGVGLASVVQRDSATGYFYWADGTSTVRRFDPATGTGVPVIESIPVSTLSGSAADEEFFYWVQVDITVRATGEKLVDGIARVRKPE